MSEILTLEGELKFLEQKNEFITPVEVWAYNNSVNRNNWQFINLEEHRAQWAGVPLLVAYVNGGRTVGSGHNQVTRVDKNGEEYQSFTDATSERICGAVSDNPEDIRIVSRDGYDWVVCKAFIYTWYNRELVDYLAERAIQGSSMSVSIEALVTESHMENGVEVEESYIPLGITLLGSRVEPAVVDAHIAMLNAMQDEFKELKIRAASYIENPDNAHSTEPEKPQENLEQKGMTKHMRLSNQQLREQQSKFADKKVLAAEQREDGSVDICLMGNGGSTYVCRLASMDETVDFERYPERMMRVNAQVHFCAEDMEDVCVDASDMTECATENSAATAQELTECKAELEKCKSELATMQANENARRLSAAKKAATDALEKFNANREEKMDVKTLEALTKEIEEGKFTACEDANHVWNGDKLVEKEVKAMCADFQTELDKKALEKRREPKPMTWGNVKQASAAPGTIGDLFASKNH